MTISLNESTIRLLIRARDGDTLARERLWQRYVPRLEGWAWRRVPAWARPHLAVGDLVQDTVLRMLKRIEQGFEARTGAGFQAYVRKILTNRIDDELQRLRRHPELESLNSTYPDKAPSPLVATLSRELLDRYESALRRLNEADQAAIMARIELGLTFEEVAAELGKPSSNAARMAVSRALERLVRAMTEDNNGGDGDDD